MMNLQLTDEQRYVLDLAIQDQTTDLNGRITKARERHEEYGISAIVRHRTILEGLLADLWDPR